MAKQRDPETLKRKLLEHAKSFPFFNLIGYEVVDFGPKWSKTRVRFRQELANPNGVIHGGVIATLMDAGITQAMLMTDEYQVVRDTRGFMTTVDLRVKYLRPLSEGAMTCEATIPHLGKRVVHASAEIKSDEGKMIATGDSILMISPGKG